MGYGIRVIIWILLLLLVGCGRQSPQRPSQRKGEEAKVDTTQLALMDLNRQLAESADEQLYRWVQTQTEPYALYEQGTWVTVLHAGEGEIVPGEECSVHMRVYSLEGKVYYDTDQTAKPGKYEFPTAIDANITEWHHGASLKLAAPWYAAYGIKGTDHIPPYENVMIELDIR
jgi:hypothetical protein